jgi:L-threonylcarbamoyladenylate synthase
LANRPDLNTTKSPENLKPAVEALKRGDLIIFPTETLYGLGADAFNTAAVERVFELKGRNRQNPVPVLIADAAMLSVLVDEIPPLAARLMDRFWPGPLTIVLPARKGTPEPLLNRRGAVGVRVSSQPVATALVKALGRPLTATSANPSGEPPARTLEEARRYFAGPVELFVDGGVLASTTGSTVVEVSGTNLKIIRAGEISAAKLAAVSKTRT